MKPLVERRKIGESRLCFLEQGEMVVPDARELGPCGLFVGERNEAKSRTQLEHRSHLAEFFGEVLGEALEDPTAARPVFEETIPGEAIEIVPYGGRRHAELARKLERVDLLSRLAVSMQDPMHELLFDDGADLLGLHLGIEIGGDRLAQERLAPALVGDQSSGCESREYRPNGRAADRKRL